jgi:hypothetical protein
MTSPYSIHVHCHRLAAWAASRAASVKGCRFKVQTGVAILEAAGFEAKLSTDDLPEPDTVDEWHARKRRAVILGASKKGVTFTHGVAAKLINCYLKVRFVCAGFHDNKRVAALHPPIDEVLLKALAANNSLNLGPQWRELRQHRWSKFDSVPYEKAIALIRRSLPPGDSMWKIEEHWKGHQ